jgi:hypothetical protein
MKAVIDCRSGSAQQSNTVFLGLISYSLSPIAPSSIAADPAPKDGISVGFEHCSDHQDSQSPLRFLGTSKFQVFVQVGDLVEHTAPLARGRPTVKLGNRIQSAKQLSTVVGKTGG